MKKTGNSLKSIYISRKKKESRGEIIQTKKKLKILEGSLKKGNRRRN